MSHKTHRLFIFHQGCYLLLSSERDLDGPRSPPGFLQCFIKGGTARQGHAHAALAGDLGFTEESQLSVGLL